MRSSLLLGAVLPLTQAIRIIQGNDDGWAENQARTFFATLTAAGHDVVLSCPAENQSGTGSSDEPPPRVGPKGCEYQSCAPGSPAIGSDARNPRLNYVNSFPVTSIKQGIHVTGPKFWGGAGPQLAVTGPNVGSNVGPMALASGTIGAAVYAVSAGVPAIAFSGSYGEPTAFNQPTPSQSRVYSELALKVTTTVINSGAPYLPTGVFLNVNFGDSTPTKCSRASDFKFIFTRINSGIISGRDTQWCGSTRLPWEADLIMLREVNDCYATISVGDASDKTTGNAQQQQAVLQKLQPILSCLPAGLQQQLENGKHNRGIGRGSGNPIQNLPFGDKTKDIMDIVSNFKDTLR